MMERIEKIKTVYKGGRFFVEEGLVNFGNGEKANLQRMVFSTGGGVFAVPIDRKGYLYLIEHYLFGIGKRMKILPIGALEKGKTAKNVIDKELQEEIGMKAGRIIKLGNLVNIPGYVNDPVQFFLALDLKPAKITGDEKMEMKVHKIKFEKAVEMVMTGKIIDVRTMLGILFAREFIKRKKVKL